MLQVSQWLLDPVVNSSFPHGGQKLIPFPVDDEPVRRLRDEDDDEHAGSTNYYHAHGEVLIRVENHGNQSSWRR